MFFAGPKIPIFFYSFFYFSFILTISFILMLQGQVFCWPYCLRARFFACPTVAGPGFLLALLMQGQVFCWPYCLRARFFAGTKTPMES